MEKMWLFEQFPENKGDCIDVWIMKITIKTNQIGMDVYFFQKQITYKNHVCP